MFVRKKKNKSGAISVQIIDKSCGYKVVKTVGSSSEEEEIARFVRRAEQIIRTSAGRQAELFSFNSADELAVENFLKGLTNSQIHTVGPELIFGALFDRIGFNAIKDEMFRHLVIARLVYPVSKLKTVDYLYRYQGITVQPDTVYRFLDKLRDRYKDRVERIAFDYTERTLKNITVVFYDMTTLYFEAEDEDDLRKIGFSKDGKFQKPQIMLGLLVGQHGYPIGYDIFEGNVFEGKTLIPTLKKIREKFNFDNPIVVADAALLSKDNLNQLKKKDYEFIIGGRIKNENTAVKKQILKATKEIQDGGTVIIKKDDGTKLIVSYSDTRQKKDCYNRERGLRKLRQKVSTGKLRKEHINNRGYNKFLKLTGAVDVTIDEQKVKDDSVWDGLKGYITNTRLGSKNVIENYRHLWQIEKAFRISKTDLRVRPIHHYRKKRIEAHICIAFVAYTLYKELERLLEKYKAGFSPKRAAELTHTMYEIECEAPEPKKITLKMDKEQQTLFDIIHKR